MKSKELMEMATSDFLDKNSAITALLPNYSTLFTKFKTNLSLIKVIQEQQATDKTGIAKNKKLLRENLSEKAFAVSNKIEVFAKMTDNLILASEVHFPKSEIQRFSDTDLRNNSQIIYNKASENIGQMAGYNLSDSDLVELKNNIDLFSSSIPSVRIGQTESKQATTQLSDLFAENDVILTKIDFLVELVRESNPAFYSEYKNVRKIITKAGSLSLVATIVDSSTGEGIKGVTVVFALQSNGNTNSGELLEKVTGDKGIFKIKTIADGIYIATASKTGYKAQSATINVASGDMAVLNMKLESN